jgi:hypothetical protein
MAMALDELLSFSDPSRCEPSPLHFKLLIGMVSGDANEGFRAGRIDAPPAYRPAFGRIRLEKHDGYTLFDVSVRGTLFDLPLTSIEQSLPNGGDPGSVSYRFRSSPQQAKRVLTARGLPVRLGQSVPMGPPDGYEYVIELLSDPRRPGHVLLSCGA